MLSNPDDILLEVKKRADSYNHVIQLFFIDLYKDFYYKQYSLPKQSYYVSLHKENHRIKKMLESDYTDVYDVKYLENTKLKIQSKLETLKLERKKIKDVFTYEFIMHKI